MSVRLLCFNIHGGYSLDGKRDLARVHNLMEEMAIDIGVFQEMETRLSYGGDPSDVDVLAGLKRLHHLPGPSLKEGLGWYGNLIVSRYPIIHAIVHDLKTALGHEPRNAVDALIKTPLGKMRVIGAHLSLSPLQRWSETRRLSKLINTIEEEEKSTVLLMGDINEWRGTSKLLRHLNTLMIPLPCGPTFPAFCPLLKLDRVWHDNPAARITARRLTGPRVRSLSDHLPLLIEVKSLG